MLHKFAAAVIGALVLVLPIAALCAPAVVAVGQAQASLQVNPDPPQVGKNHFILSLSGATSEQLSKTSASFGTMMPSMSMGGPSGRLKMTAPGRFEFDATLGMAAAWDITLKFDGALTGTATYHFAVGTAAPEMHSSAAAAPSSSMVGMAGMASTGDVGAWRTATFALVVILLAGMGSILFLERERRALVFAITAGAAVLTLALAVVQARYAAPAMDMAAMTVVPGYAPVPVTLATVRGAQGGSVVFAPGAVSAYLTQDIVTRAAGILREFNAYAGDRLRAGQVIATLEAPDLQSQAAAAVADAAAQANSARAAEIEAQHHAPNGVIIANAQTSAMEQDLAARSDQTAKREQVRYWQNEIRREASLLSQGAVSQQEYQDERAQAATAQAAYDASTQHIAALQQQLVASRTKAMDAVASVSQMRAQASAALDQAARARANALTQTTVAG